MIQLKCTTVIFIVLNSSHCPPAWVVLIRKSGDNILGKVLIFFQSQTKALWDEVFLKYELHCKVSFVIYKSYLTMCALCSQKPRKIKWEKAPERILLIAFSSIYYKSKVNTVECNAREIRISLHKFVHITETAAF